MRDNIERYISKIPNFLNLSPGDMIPYFVYYLNKFEKKSATTKSVAEYFTNLKLQKYSNISAYLSKNSKGKNPIFIKEGKGYFLTRKKQEEISKVIDEEQDIIPTNELVELELLNSCPFYIRKIAKQMSGCYDNKLWDACLVMMRKLYEVLIIECFEKYQSQSEIKNSEGDYYYFGELINKFITSTHWGVSRNLKKNINIIKKYGDLSAHNRRFLARKSDIDSFKIELRQCLQEIVLIIGYED